MRNGREVVLLVEGNEDIRNALKALLENNHYEIIVTGDGKQALDYLKENAYDMDLVVAALDIPVIGGIEMLKLMKLSQRMKDIPVVVMLPMNRESEQKDVMDNGAEDILFFPFDSRVVLNRVHNILMSSRRPTCVNIMEELAARELNRCIDSLGICKCRQCRKDVITLSLNRLKPRYVSSAKGKLLSELDQMSYDYVPEMLRALTESAEIVKKNPRHS